MAEAPDDEPMTPASPSPEPMSLGSPSPEPMSPGSPSPPPEPPSTPPGPPPPPAKPISPASPMLEDPPPLPLLGYESTSDTENDPEYNPAVNADVVRAIEETFRNITWFTRYTTILDNSLYKHPKWFSGGHVNVCFELLDRHLKSNGDKTAFIIRKSNCRIRMTYQDLFSKVKFLANSLARSQLQDPDRVLILLPNCIEAIFSVLACFRLGLIFSILFTPYDFIIQRRIVEFKPNVIITTNRAYPGLDFPKMLSNIFEKLDDDYIPQHVFVVKGSGMDKPEFKNVKKIRTHEFLTSPLGTKPDSDTADFINNYDINKPLYVAFTSGVTGTPMGCFHSARSILMSCLSDEGVMFLNASERELDNPVSFFLSDLQHVVGLMGICVKPLFYLVTSVVYEALIYQSTPKEIFEFIEHFKITTLYISGHYLYYLYSKSPKGTNANPSRSAEYKVVKFYTGEMNIKSKVLRWAERLFGYLPLYQCYVITELCGIITQHKNSPKVPRDQDDLNRDVALGQLIPFIDIRLFKGQREMSGTNWGEVSIKLPVPPVMMLFYLHTNLTKQKFKIRPGFFIVHDLIKFNADREVVWISKSDYMTEERFQLGLAERDFQLIPTLQSEIMEYNQVIDCAIIIRTDDYDYSKAFAFYTSQFNGDFMNKRIESIIFFLHGSQLEFSAVHLGRMPLTEDNTAIATEDMEVLLNMANIPDELINEPNFASFILKVKEIRRSRNPR